MSFPSYIGHGKAQKFSDKYAFAYTYKFGAHDDYVGAEQSTNERALAGLVHPKVRAGGSAVRSAANSMF